MEMTQNPFAFVSPTRTSTQTRDRTRDRTRDQPIRNSGPKVHRLSVSPSACGPRESTRDGARPGEVHGTRQAVAGGGIQSTGEKLVDVREKRASNTDGGFADDDFSDADLAELDLDLASGLDPDLASDLDPELDLDRVFSCEPLWDDPADDEMLCEVCEDLESQIQERGAGPQRETANQKRAEEQMAGPVTNHVTAFRTGANQMQSYTGTPQSEFTFKKPAPVSTVKCSVAQIELKRQQATERRRQRLQEATQRPIRSQFNHWPITNQRTPT